jgi:hypothetical protein
MSTPGNTSSGSTPAARITCTASSCDVRRVSAAFRRAHGLQPPRPGCMTLRYVGVTNEPQPMQTLSHLLPEPGQTEMGQTPLLIILFLASAGSR